MDRKYKFSWDLIGDLSVGRPNLGAMVRVEVYRLMQFAFRDRLEAEFGTKKADEVFYAAGKLAGCEFYENFCTSHFQYIHPSIFNNKHFGRQAGTDMHSCPWHLWKFCPLYMLINLSAQVIFVIIALIP